MERRFGPRGPAQIPQYHPKSKPRNGGGGERSKWWIGEVDPPHILAQCDVQSNEPEIVRDAPSSITPGWHEERPAQLWCLQGDKDPDHGRGNNYDLAVIGYGDHISSAWGGALVGRELVSIVEVADNPIGVTNRGDGTALPLWFEAVGNGPTPMSGAMQAAGQVTASWVVQHPDSIPPIIINISDGAGTDGDPRLWAQRLGSLADRNIHPAG